ncbi:hypothetical protein C1646_812438 [Rhizophagus diaphanus]|nr:hypothetical protein C1646_812438 [Rhizophagus diaphanus] [Rhizophagus sp. MUCL 43196]
MANYDQMDDPTSAAFDIFFSGIIPIGYSVYFEPLLSTTLKSKIEDFVFFFVEPLIPLFYAFNKITYNEFDKRHIIFICVYSTFRIVSAIIYYSILAWIKKTNRYFGYKSLKHCILFVYFGIIEYCARFVPMMCLEDLRKTGSITELLNGVAILGIIFGFFAFVLLLPHILYKNRRDFPIVGNIIYSIYTFSSFYISIVYLVIVPSNVIYVKIAFNINLLLIMRFFTICNDKPRNKNRGLGCIILFAFDDIKSIEKELKNENTDKYWYEIFLSHRMIKPIIDEIKKRILKRDKDQEYYEDRLICNRANILYYYKYGEALEKKRSKKRFQNTIQSIGSASSIQSIGSTSSPQSIGSTSSAQSIGSTSSVSSTQRIGSTSSTGNSTAQDHEFVLDTYIPGIILHNEIKKANKVYKLFNGIGTQNINNVKSLSATDIARLEDEEINKIIKSLKVKP